tara:strand:+ start:1034 stop:1333 length:300 start_codon:yes stop_codon:yes gene_type:complete
MNTLHLPAIHISDIDFYQALLGDDLIISDRFGDMCIIADGGYFELTNKQYALMLLKDPDFMTVQQENELHNQWEYEQRIERIRTWQLKRTLKKQKQLTN